MKKFNVLLVDLPWVYNSKKTGGSMTSGSAYQYPTLAIKEMCNLTELLDPILEKNCLLFLWVPVPLMREGIDIIDCWGFKYKSKYFWVKDYGGNKLGMGAWFRNHIEELWICIRGKVPAFHMHQKNWMEVPVQQHSQKPINFKWMIGEVTRRIGFNNRLELFGREKDDRSWTILGNEIDGLDIREALKGLNEETLMLQ